MVDRRGEHADQLRNGIGHGDSIPLTSRLAGAKLQSLSCCMAEIAF